MKRTPAAGVSTSGNFQEAGMRNPGSLYLIIGALIAVIVVGGFFFYQERHKSGIDVEVGDKGISVETH